MGWPKGRKPHNWKGGRVVDPRGYILIHVGKDHPLADVRGYAYEHRLIAQRRSDRPLTYSDIVHHDDDAKGNNSPDNLILTDRPWHMVAHRKLSSAGLRLPGEPNPLVNCACGCGAIFERYDETGRPRRYVSGHNPPLSSPTIDAVLAALRGSTSQLGPSQIAAAIGKHSGIVRTTLGRLAARKVVTRIGRGKWSIIS